MKTHYFLYLMLSLTCSVVTDSLAQRSLSRISNYDAVTTYRIGMQSISLNELNQVLQQAGYQALASQMPMVSVASQFSRPNRPLAFLAEAGIAIGSGTNVTNGQYKAQAGIFYAKLGASYRIIRKDKFELAPQLSLVSLPFHMRVTPVNGVTPSLNTVLTNPGSAQTATFRTSALGLDAGLTANMRIPYGQRQYDCATVERSFVIGLDAGYRLASRAPFDNRYEISSTNPAIQLSGWYAGLRLGFGMRVRSTTNPVTY